LNGESAFDNPKKPPSLPQIIGEEELHDEEFVEKYSKHLDMMMDITKT